MDSFGSLCEEWVMFTLMVGDCNGETEEDVVRRAMFNEAVLNHNGYLKGLRAQKRLCLNRTRRAHFGL